MLNKREEILSDIKGTASWLIKKNINFGIRVPQIVIETLRLDENNGNRLCIDGIAKEINEVMIAFKILDEWEISPPTYQDIRCHVVFDIKMEDFRRKDQYAAGGHATVAPPTLTYVRVVSRESSRIVLKLDALNDLEVKTSDIQNAYLTVPCSEKIWTTLGS